jgi:hypothetical protein
MASNTDRLVGKLAGTHRVSAVTRARTATFTQPNAPAGTQKNRFPMPDKAHARLALAMLPRAKNMPPGAAAKVRARADRMLGK